MRQIRHATDEAQKAWPVQPAQNALGHLPEQKENQNGVGYVQQDVRDMRRSWAVASCT